MCSSTAVCLGNPCEALTNSSANKTISLPVLDEMTMELLSLHNPAPAFKLDKYQGIKCLIAFLFIQGKD